ncbi:MAG TPA: P22 phage major capsid protein family protein, partial [Candidatus Woesebacteria bacterium]|nr:P22 phage major capsid protein family protein [Candidatus Woesebacteria bacterium]
MANTGVADVSATIQKVVSAVTTRTLIQESVALAVPGVWDRSNEVGPGMDRLDMIELASLSVQTVDETGAAMTPQTINPSAALLVLDQNKSVPFALTHRGQLQSKIALVSKTIENGARSLAADLDDYVFAQAVAAAATTITVAGADGLEDVRAAKKVFDDANVPRFSRAIVGSSEWINNKLLATNTVIRANEYGSNAPIRTGFVAELLGFMIFESNSSSIPNDGFLALGAEAVAFARQRSVSLESQVQVLSQKTDYALTHLFGAEATAASNPRIMVYDPV